MIWVSKNVVLEKCSKECVLDILYLSKSPDLQIIFYDLINECNLI